MAITWVTTDRSTTRMADVQYANFSGWDIYRSEAQLIGMLAPKEASDMAQSLVNDYQQGGAFPRWGVTTMDSGVMMGDPAAPIIADYYAFGATNFDTQAALAGLLNAATNPAVYARTQQDARARWVGGLLETRIYARTWRAGRLWLRFNDCWNMTRRTSGFRNLPRLWAIESDSEMLLKHAQNWRNLYNPETGYIQMKRPRWRMVAGFHE